MGTYYLAGHSNTGDHVIPFSNDTQSKLITSLYTSFINSTVSSLTSGPNGLVTLPDRNELYAGDGDASVKAISLLTNIIIANTQSTAFEPPNHLFLGCSQTQLTTFGFATSYITDVATGSIIANTNAVSSSDQAT